MRTIARLRMMGSYLALRATMPSRYRRSALDDLLSVLDRHAGRSVFDDDALRVGILRAERIAPRLRMTPDTCLFRALTRYGALRRAGRAPLFVMGIDESDDDIGHAWIELDGRPWLEPPLRPMARTFEHPPCSRTASSRDV